MILASIATLLGGVGLFLLGMRLMTQGLRLAAGRALRTILTQSTRTKARGLLSGFAITALVQSSSAVTVAVIGFVNAGLLTLKQTVAVIYGSNIGTTVTGWIVAAVGLSVSVKAMALPLVALGVFMRLTGENTRRAPIGDALAGFGIFFLGIEVLQGAFQGLQTQLPMGALHFTPLVSIPIFLAVGFALTMLMQSSSAAMAVVLTAGAGGMIPLSSAAAAVIGTNIGTTSTAALSVIGATNNAKRVAAAHIIFNLVTAAVALLLMPVLLKIVVFLADLAGTGQDQAPTLAMFHTCFNILGVALFWPFTDRLVRFIVRKVGRRVQDLGTPRFLDHTVLASPTLAMDALTLELSRINEIGCELGREVLQTTNGACKLSMDKRLALDELIRATRAFCMDVQKTNLPPLIARNLPLALRILQYNATVGELAEGVCRDHSWRPDGETPNAVAKVRWFTDESMHLLNIAAHPCSEELDHPESLLNEFKNVYSILKNTLLDDGGEGRMDVDYMVHRLEVYSSIRRMVEQSVKAADYWAELRNLTQACEGSRITPDTEWSDPA